MADLEPTADEDPGALADPDPTPTDTDGPVGTGRRFLLTIAIAAMVIVLLDVVLLGHPSPDGYCFYRSVGLVGWTALSSLIAASVCSAYLAATETHRSAYFLLIVVVAVAAGLGFWLALVGSDCVMAGEDARAGIPGSVIGLVAASLGVVPGVLVGHMVRAFRRPR